MGAGHSPWFRMWSRKSLSVANLLEQWEHWKRCSGVEWAERRGLKRTGMAEERGTVPNTREPPRSKGKLHMGSGAQP